MTAQQNENMEEYKNCISSSRPYELHVQEHDMNVWAWDTGAHVYVHQGYGYMCAHVCAYEHMGIRAHERSGIWVYMRMCI